MKKPMLGRKYDGQEPTGWLMSEKLDGFRAVWTGSELMTRGGHTFHAPEWFLAELPSGVCLDGELYLGPRALARTSSILQKRTPVDAEWQQIRFRVFDAPKVAGGFSTRLGFAENALEGNRIASVIPHRTCASRDELAEFLTQIFAHEGEGVMLRNPSAPYVHGRTTAILKVLEHWTKEASA